MKKQRKKVLMGLNRKSRLLFLVAVSMGLLGSAIYFFAKQNKWLENEFATQVQNVKLNEEIAELSLYIKNAESADRGYVISGDRKFVENFDAAIDSIRAIYSEIQQLENRKEDGTDAVLFLKSDSLVKQKIAFMQRVKSLCDNNECKAAAVLIASNEGLHLSDSIVKINKQIGDHIQAQVKRSQTGVLKARRRNNNLAYISITVSMLLILLVFYFLIKEIKRVKSISEELRVRKEYFKVTLNSLAEGLITTDTEGRVLYMNPAAESLTGWGWKDAKNQPLHHVFNVINETTRKPIENIVSRILKDGKKIEWENNTILKAKNTGIYIISNNGSPLLDLSGRITGAVLVFNDITEKQKMLNELKGKEKQYRSLIQNLPEAVYTCDASGYIQLYNKAAVELWGREPVAGKDLWCGSWKIFNTDSSDLPLDSCPMAICLKEGRPVHGKEIMVQRPDGNFRHVLPYPSPLFNADGQLTGAINMLLDITDKKEREILIRKNEEKYLAIFNNSLDGVALTSPDGQIFAVNPAACSMLGRSEEEICSLGRSAVFNENNPGLQSLLYERKQKGRIQGEIKMRKKNGKEFLAEFSSTSFTDIEGKEKAVTTFRDITERKMAEKEARDFRYALDESAIVTISDAEGRILYTNDNFCRISQYSREELIGQKHGIVNSGYHPDSFFTNLWVTIGSGKIWRGEIRNKAKDGSFFWMDTTIVPFLNGAEKPNRYIAIRHDITERKKAETALAESENYLRTIIEAEPECVDLLNIHCELEDMNKTGLEMIEADNLMQVKGKSVLSIINEPYREAFKSLTENIFKGKSGRLEFEITGLKGTKRWMETHAVPLKNVDGKIISQLSVTRDITERKKAEQELQSSRKQFQSLVENISGVYWVNNLETYQTLYVSPSYETVWGRKCEDLYKSPKDFINAVHPEDKQSLLKVFNSLTQTHKANITYRIIRPGGGIRWIAAKTNVVTDSNGNKMEYGYAEDISERKEAEEKILESEERYKDIVENITDLICTHDLSGRILSMNKAAEKLTGTKFNPKSYFNIKDILTSGSKNMFESYISEIKKNGYVHSFMKVKLPDGQIRTWEFKNSLKTTGGSTPIVRGYAQDVTENKKAEEMLKKSFEDIRRLATHLEKVREEERTNMAREIHDELGQQLTVMKMDVSWLEEKFSKTDKTVRQRTETLKVMLDKTVTTVRQLAYKLRPSMLDDMGLGAAIEWQLAEFEKRSGVKTELLKQEKELDLPDTIKTGLFRIVQESLTNVARYAQAKNVTVHMKRQEKELVLTIKDDGIGFDKEKATAKKTLGILGMQERTLIMEGTYDINSTPGKGTVVTVRVPLKK